MPFATRPHWLAFSKDVLFWKIIRLLSSVPTGKWQEVCTLQSSAYAVQSSATRTILGLALIQHYSDAPYICFYAKTYHLIRHVFPSHFEDRSLNIYRPTWSIHSSDLLLWYKRNPLESDKALNTEHTALGECGVRDRLTSLQAWCECSGVRDINLKHTSPSSPPLCPAQMGMCVADHYHDAICSGAAVHWRDALTGETSAHPKLCNGEMNHQRHKLKMKCSVGTEGGCREKGAALDGFG